jgi:hypothetical protein
MGRAASRAASFLNPIARGTLPFDVPADILDRLEQSVREGRFSGGVYAVDLDAPDEADYRTRAGSEGTLRLKKMRPYHGHVTLRLVGRRLEYEIGYPGLRRQNIQIVGIFAGLVTLTAAIVAIRNPSAALMVALVAGGFLAFMVALARLSGVGEPLVQAVAAELRSVELEERIRDQVRRELRSKYRVVEDEARDIQEGESDATELRRRTR